MILADKIMMLRKKNGWSQEELADKLGVSRQSVSKYEGAQSVPDLDKIVKLSQIFGVTTDYLMKDEMEDEEYVSFSDETEQIRHKVTMEMAYDYLKIVRKSSGKIAFATALCVLSPICLLLLIAACENPRFSVHENAAIGIGVSVLLLFVASAVAVFILYGMKKEKYSFIEKEDIETAYGVIGMVKEQKEKFHDTYVRNNIIGTVCCICASIPLFIGIAVTEDEFTIMCMICMLLGAVAVGVYFFVVGNTQMEAMNQLLEEADFTREKKKSKRKMSAAETAYWLIMTAIYLAVSFWNQNWERSWILWPVAGVFYPVFDIIAEKIMVKDDK